MWSDLTLDPSFKVKQEYPNLKVLISHLLLVLEVCNVKQTYRKSFEVWPLFQGQMRIAKIKSTYNSLIHVTRGLQCHTNLLEIMG